MLLDFNLGEGRGALQLKKEKLELIDIIKMTKFLAIIVIYKLIFFIIFIYNYNNYTKHNYIYTAKELNFVKSALWESTGFYKYTYKHTITKSWDLSNNQ